MDRCAVWIGVISGLAPVLLGAAAPPVSAASEIVLAGRSGSSAATIVLAQDATELEQFAAEELRAYVAKLTRGKDGAGVKLPIIHGDDPGDAARTCEILIGRCATHSRLKSLAENAKLRLDQAALGEDGYVIKCVPGANGAALLLTGSHERSCLFAVYHLLELCGVNFFGYRDRNGEVVPCLDKVALAAPDVVAVPRMKYRFVSDNNFSATDKSKLIRVADWAAKNRCNAFVITPSRAGETWEQIAVDEVRKRGLMIVGPGHILARLTPDLGLFDTHPEYFPLIKDRRRADFSKAWGGVPSFCWSNDEAMKIVVAHAAEYVARNPCIDIFSLYPPDGPLRGSQCQCAGCARRSLSDWYLTLINGVSAALRERRPGMKTMWISYNECGVVPRTEHPADHGSGQILLWCNDLRDHHEPMDSGTNRRPAAYLRWKPSLKSVKTDGKKNPGDIDLAAFHRWRTWAEYLRAGEYRGEVVLLDYYNAHVAASLKVPWLGFCQSGPWPGDVMQRDFQWYAAEGIVGWQNCTDYYNDSPNPWWNWIAARLLWDPAANVPALHGQFCRAYYGPAGSRMLPYLDLLWKEVASEEFSAATPERFKKLDAMLREAENAARNSDDEDIRRRMAAARSFHTSCQSKMEELATKER